MGIPTREIVTGTRWKRIQSKPKNGRPERPIDDAKPRNRSRGVARRRIGLAVPANVATDPRRVPNAIAIEYPSPQANEIAAPINLIGAAIFVLVEILLRTRS
jgi:hypothetical protein